VLLWVQLVVLRVVLCLEALGGGDDAKGCLSMDYRLSMLLLCLEALRGGDEYHNGEHNNLVM
jgi:hypothetical protein